MTSSASPALNARSLSLSVMRVGLLTMSTLSCRWTPAEPLLPGPPGGFEAGPELVLHLALDAGGQRPVMFPQEGPQGNRIMGHEFAQRPGHRFHHHVLRI